MDDPLSTLTFLTIRSYGNASVLAFDIDVEICHRHVPPEKVHGNATHRKLTLPSFGLP